MTQDPFGEAWDKGGTATADPFAAAWDAEPAPTDSRSQAEATGAIPRRRVPLAQHRGTEGSPTLGADVLDAVSKVGPALGEFSGRVLNAPVKAAKDVSEFAARVADKGLSAVTGGAPTPFGDVAESFKQSPELPHIPGQEGTMASKLGDSAGFVATAAIPGAAASGFMRLAPGAIMGAASSGVALHQRVLETTGDADKAMVAMLQGAGVGGTIGVLPVARVLARLNQASGGILVRSIQDIGVGVGTGMAQSALNDVIVEHATGEDLPILKNAVEAGELGGLTMLLAGGVAEAVKVHGEPLKVEKSAAEGEVAPEAGEKMAAPRGEDTPPDSGLGRFAETGDPVPVREGTPEPRPYTHPDLATPEQPVAPREVAPERAPKPPWYKPTPEESVRMDKLLELPTSRLETELVERLGLEDETLRAAKGGRGDAWYQQVAELRRQAREPGNPESEKAAETLSKLKVEPSGHNVEEVISALRIRDKQGNVERAARKGVRPSEKFQRSQKARAEVEAAWKEFGDYLRGKSFSGVDPEVVAKAAKVAKAYVKQGTQGFIDFAHDAIARFGEAIRPHVHDIWRKAGGSPAPLEKRAEITGEKVPEKRALPIKKTAPEPKPEIQVAKVVEPEKPPLPVEKVAAEEKPAVPLRKIDEPTPEPVKPAAFDHTLGGNLNGFTVNQESVRDLLRREIVDKFARVRDVEKALGGTGGVDAQETVFHGRVGARADWVNRRVDEVVKVARKAGITLKELGDFLYARHVGDREKALGEGSAGMSATDAQKILDRAAKEPAFARVAQIHDAIQQRKLDMLEEAGNLSPEERKAWEEKFGSTYTPLKTVDEPAETHIRGGGGSFNIQGREARTAKGRKSEAFNPLVQSIADAYEATFRSEKNKVGGELLDLVRKNPATELWQEYADANEIPVKERDRVFHTKEAGQDRFIVIRDKVILDSLKGLGLDQVPRVLKFAAVAGNFYKKLHTTWDPEFLVSNAAKDLQEAGLNLTATRTAKLGGKVVLGAPRAMGAMWQVLSNENATGKWAEYAREFRDEGGMTNWTDRKTIQQLENDLEAALGRGKLKEIATAIPHLIERANESVENGTRLSTYIQMREAGFSKRDSAVGAKTSTVNFDRKGNLSPTLNTLYLFFNAGVQGTATTVRAVRANPKKVASMMGGLAAAGFAVSWHNRLNGGTDEKDGENRWEKESLDHKAHSFEWMKTNGKVIKFPLPWLWGIPFHTGTLAEHLVNGKTKPLAAAGSMAASFAAAVSPLSGGTVGQTVSPWFADPLVAVDENKNYRGAPIYPDGYGSPLPSAQRRTFGASKLAKSTSETLNAATGGDVGRKGLIDVAPDTIDYLFGEAGGGAGRFLQRIWKTAENKLSGEETPWIDVPFLNRFMGDPSPFAYQSEFRADLKAIAAERAAQKAGTKYDEDAVAFYKSAAKYEHGIKLLRDAGREDEADDLAAEFHKMFSARSRR